MQTQAEVYHGQTEKTNRIVFYAAFWSPFAAPPVVGYGYETCALFVFRTSSTAASSVRWHLYGLRAKKRHRRECQNAGSIGLKAKRGLRSSLWAVGGFLGAGGAAALDGRVICVRFEVTYVRFKVIYVRFEVIYVRNIARKGTLFYNCLTFRCENGERTSCDLQPCSC